MKNYVVIFPIIFRFLIGYCNQLKKTIKINLINLSLHFYQKITL